MADSNATTPAPAERNTPREIIFDMEDDISTLRRHANIVLILSTDEGLEDVHKDALHQVADGLSDCHRDLKDKFKRLFDHLVRTDGDKPEELDAMEARVQADVEAIQRDNEARWGKLYGEWLRQQATYAEGPVGDEEGDRLSDREGEIVHAMIMMPAPDKPAILNKIDILHECIRTGSNWTDRREFLLLASIKADVEELS